MLNQSILSAVDVLKNGGVIAYSTETVIGLGCDPENEQAIKKILWLKSRAADSGLILLVPDVEAIKRYSPNLTSKQQLIIEDSSLTTWLIPFNSNVSKLVAGSHDKIAVRIAEHEIAKQICLRFGAIISTSANYSGIPTVNNSTEIKNWFGPNLDYVIIGEQGNNQPSKIVDVVSGEVIR